MPKILIVDDEWLTRLEIEEMLTDLGYDVAGQAETGAEAVAMARELNPDLILMDVKMPGEMNGIDAAREIKAELGTPIVFISGYGDPEYIEAAKEIAPFGYVMKPFDEREIHAFVEIALSRRKLELKLEKSHEQLEQTNLDLQSEIAARKKTETALQESQKLYRDIFEKNNAMKWLLDPSSGKIIDANPAACEFYQYSHEEITKLRLWDINIESEANVRKRLADANSDENTEFTFKHRLASGEIRDVQVYTGALVSGEKKLLHSIIIDITERIRAEELLKHAHDTLEQRVESSTAALRKANKQLQEENEAHKRTEEALRESEEHHHSFMESAKGFIVYRLEVDPENYFSGRLIFVSPGIEDEIGVSPEAEFSEWFKSVHPDDLPSLIEAQSKSVQNGDTFDQEFRWKNLMGEWRWCHAISNPVFDSEGKPKYFNGMIIDVTPQKQAEKSLQESERHLRSLMENATNFAVYRLISDDDNPSLLSVIFVSPSITDIMGVSEPMSFETWFEHVHPDDVERIVKANIEAFKTLRFDETMRIYHPQEQKWVWIHAISTGFEDQERQCKYVNGILFDITRQKKSNEALRESEEALKESESFLSTLINAIPAPVFYKDMDGKYLGFNSAFETFFGETRERLIGKSVFDINPPELAEIYNSQDNELLNSGGSQIYESQWKNAHGKLRDFIFSKAVFTDSKGTITGLIGVLTDITERKRTEQALKNNQNFLNRIIDQSPFATWISDEKGTMIKCNAALKKFLNITDEQLIGKYNVFEDKVAIEQGLIPKIRTVFEDGKTANFSVEWDANELGYKDAQKVHIEGTMFPIYDDKGDLTNVVDHWIDITERKRAERELRESEEYHRDLFENSPTALYLQDFTGVEEQVKGLKSAGITDLGSHLRANPEVALELSRAVVFSSVNQAAVDLYKARSKRNLMGSLDRVLIQGDFQHFIAQVVAFTNGEDSWEGEARNYNFQKEIIDIVIKKGVINRQSNGMSKVLVSITDVTELHKTHKNKERLEAQLHRAQKMEAIGTLAGGVAHDLNNILGGLVSYPELLLMQLPDDSPLRKSILTIQKSGEKAAAVVQDLLTLARRGVVTTEVVSCPIQSPHDTSLLKPVIRRPS